MAKKRQTPASEDGVALFKAIGLLLLTLPLVAVGSLAGAFGGHWILGVPFWTAAALAIWKAHGPLVREFRLYDKEAAHPLAVLDTESERDRCPCCRYPTIEAGNDTCLLCDWTIVPASETDAPVTLGEGRKNFVRHFSIYDPEESPDWIMPSPDEVDVKRRLIIAYQRIGQGKRTSWLKARSLEKHLAVMRHRSVVDEPTTWPELPRTESGGGLT
jgi:hypothetical protein